MLGGDNRSAAGGGEGNPGGSDGRKYLPPKIGKQTLIARFYYNLIYRGVEQFGQLVRLIT